MNVTTFYLQMLDPGWLRGKAQLHARFKVCESEIAQAAVNRFVYRHIAAVWQRTDRDAWSEDAWRVNIATDRLRTWVAYDRGTRRGISSCRSRPGTSSKFSTLAWQKPSSARVLTVRS